MKRWSAIPLTLLLAACLSHPPPPDAPYRAVGQAADWTLIIDDRHVTWIGAPGQAPLRVPKPAVIVGVAGEIYRTPRIDVNIVHQPCVVPGRTVTFPDSVQVQVDGRSYTGCGGL